MFALTTILAFLTNTVLLIFLILTLVNKSFLFTTPFSYATTPTNVTTMQLYFTHGETYFDGELQPSSTCTTAFTNLTCGLLTSSTVLIGLSGVMVLVTMGLLYGSRREGQSKVHGMYLATGTLTFGLLLSAYLVSISASGRLLRNELPDMLEGKLSRGVEVVVEGRVEKGIKEKWEGVNRAAEDVRRSRDYYTRNGIKVFSKRGKRCSVT
jgi:hypothetical protein